jgi:hypothetical protein
MSSPPWLAKEMEPKQNLFPDYLSSILHGALVGAGSFPLVLPCSGWSPLTGQKSFDTQNYVQHVNYPPYKICVTVPTLFFPCWLMRQPAAPPSTTKTKSKGESKGPTDNTCNALFTLELESP